MKLTRRIRKSIHRKLKASMTRENLLTRAFRKQVRNQLYDRIKLSTSWEEVNLIISEFDISSIGHSMEELANSIFNRSTSEMNSVLVSFLANPKNKYLDLRSRGMLQKKEDFKPYLDAYKHNVSLIKDLPRDLAIKLQSAYFRGTSFRGTAFAKELQERLGVRARMIVRTESAKISSTLTQVRMQKLGLSAYIWSTSEDSRVRNSHSMLDGVLFFWNDPPTLDNYRDHCGRFVNCRCVPIPVTQLGDIRFPVKVAESINLQTKYIKGGKGLVESKIVSGAIMVYTRDKFIEKYGDNFI